MSHTTLSFSPRTWTRTLALATMVCVQAGATSEVPATDEQPTAAGVTHPDQVVPSMVSEPVGRGEEETCVNQWIAYWKCLLSNPNCSMIMPVCMSPEEASAVVQKESEAESGPGERVAE